MISTGTKLLDIGHHVDLISFKLKMIERLVLMLMSQFGH